MPWNIITNGQIQHFIDQCLSKTLIRSKKEQWFYDV